MVTEQAGPAAEQEEQQQEEAEAAAAPGAETPADKNTTAAASGTEDSTVGEAPDTVKPTGESVSDSDAGTQDTTADDEKKAAVQKVQALIDALPETVTVENAESVGAQLEAIEAAMAELTEEQTDQLNMARYAALCAAAVALTAEQNGEHVHPICGASCTEVHENVTWTGVSELTNNMAEGNYYLTGNITLTEVWAPVNNVNLCLNGYNIEYTPVKNNTDADRYAIDVKDGVTVSLCDAHGSGTVNSTKNSWNSCVRAWLGTINLYDGVTLSAYNTGVSINAGGRFNMYGGTVTGKNWGVNVAEGYFAMHSGEISGSESYGGVYVSGYNTTEFTGSPLHCPAYVQNPVLPVPAHPEWFWRLPWCRYSPSSPGPESCISAAPVTTAIRSFAAYLHPGLPHRSCFCSTGQRLPIRLLPCQPPGILCLHLLYHTALFS